MGELFLWSLFLVHWLADFVFQSHEQAINKWHSISALLRHTWMYSAIWAFFFILVGWFTLSQAHLWILFGFKFAGITFVAHTITDYFTSKLSHYYFKKENYHNGFVVVGLDQILHYAQLYYTFKYLLT